MEEMYLRIGILTLLILPMVISDWLKRMVNQETILIGVAVCFFIHDVSIRPEQIKSNIDIDQQGVDKAS